MRLNSSLIGLISHLLQPDRIFQPTTDEFYYATIGGITNMPARLDSFHEGEAAMRSLLKVPGGGYNPTSAGLPYSYGMQAAASPLFAVGTLDARGRPWTTLWGGERGFAGPIADGVLGMNSGVDIAHDPVYEALWGEEDEGERKGGVVQPDGGRGKMMAALALDLESRARVKLMGLMVAGAADVGDKTLQMAFLVTESLGNCPKYLNKKRVVPRKYGDEEAPVEVKGEAKVLADEAVALLDKADMFFMSSTNGDTMDTNHRGGPAGFVRVLRNEVNEAVLVYPEYSGNRLYQTLGNLKVNPLVGIIVPDYDTADVLYLTGSSSILVGADAASVIAHTSLAVQITITSARFIRRGLPFRGTPLEKSPYNPPVRHLTTEKDARAAANAFDTRPGITATLTSRDVLSPSINRFTFALEARDGETLQWRAGQHVTLGFAEELDHGYSHMRDDDPQSLNDDFVRTFTVSSAPSGVEGGKAVVQITARRNGPVTGLLWKHNMRMPLEIPVLGFGGEESFRMPTAREGAVRPVFVAGGVGITPLLAQAEGVLEGGVPLEVLWSLGRKDLGLAVDTFSRIKGLARRTRVFVSGGDDEMEGMEKLRELGVKGIEFRRIEESDVKMLGGEGAKFYLCAGATLLRSLREWLVGQDTVSEDFSY